VLQALQDESGRITELQGQLAAQAAQRPAGPTAAVQGEALASQQEAAAGVDVAAAAPDAPDAATAGQVRHMHRPSTSVLVFQCLQFRCLIA